MTFRRCILRSCIVVGLVAAIGVNRLAARGTPRPDSLATGGGISLSDCIRLALERNPRVRISEHDFRAAELSQQEFQKSRLPAFSLSAGASYAPHNDRAGFDPVSTNGGEVSGLLEVEQQLYDAGVKNLKLDQLQTDLDRTKLQRTIAARDLRYDVELAVIEVLRTHDVLALRTETLSRLGEYQRLAEQLGHAGQVGATDLLRARVELSNARIEKNRAQTTADGAAIDLEGLIFFKRTAPESMIPVSGDLDHLLDSSNLSFSGITDSLPSLDVSLAQNSVTRNLFDLDITRRERMPTISFQGAAGFLSSMDNLQLPADERVFPFGFVAGVSLTMPLFSWGASDIRIQEREIAIQSQREQVTLARNAYRTQVEKTVTELHGARQRVSAIDSSLQSADEAYRLTLAKYAGGGALSLELLSALQLVSDTRLNRLEEIADVQRSYARLEQLRTH